MVHTILARLFFPNTDRHPVLDTEMTGRFAPEGGKKRGYLRGKDADLELIEVVHAPMAEHMHFTALLEGTKHRIEFVLHQVPSESPFSCKETPSYWAGTFKGPPSIGEGRVRACISLVEPWVFATPAEEAKPETPPRFKTDYVPRPVQASL